MTRKLSRQLLILAAVSLILSAGFSSENTDLSKLNGTDKAQIAEFHRLKKKFGSAVWPGFGEEEIPLILYNERYEFLIGHPDPPSSWILVENDFVQGRPYYRRDITDPQAFAVPVGDFWAGSLDTLGSMNRSMKEQIQEKIPPEKLTPSMIKMMEFSPAHHAVALLHEAFHAYMATKAKDRFLHAQKMYGLEKRYPFEDNAFKSAWNEEGSLLASALKKRDTSAMVETIEEFLVSRVQRRSQEGLSPDLVSFERELEWLEGLAKYVEMKFAELGSSSEDKEKSKDYRIVRNRLKADFYFRLGKLGELDGDLRFYLSGSAQAMLLDSIKPGWKQDIAGKNAGLEDLLAAALKKNSGRPFTPVCRRASE